jgi:hypothetical protein
MMYRYSKFLNILKLFLAKNSQLPTISALVSKLPFKHLSCFLYSKVYITLVIRTITLFMKKCMWVKTHAFCSFTMNKKARRLNNFLII